MAYLNFKERRITNWVPAAYASDETDTSFLPVNAGELVGPAICRVRVAFNGTGGRTAAIGDGGDADRFFNTTDLDITTAGLYKATGGSGAQYAAIGTHLYTAADTIDNTFVAATGGSPTAGSLDFWFYIARVDPH